MSSREQHYWRKGHYDALQAVSTDSRAESWPYYRDYCLAQENGVRKEAFAHLDLFLESISKEPAGGKMEFIRWVMPLAHHSPNYDQLLPHPLIEKLIKPTLAEMLMEQNADPDLLFWYGYILRDSAYFERAIKIRADHVESRSMLIEWMLGDLEYATHELPEAFLGDPEEVLRGCDEAESMIHDSLPNDRAKRFANEINELRELTEDYLRRRR